MQILGIDFGKRKIGFSIADSKSNLAEPLKVISFRDLREGMKKVKDFIHEYKPSLIVIGISEGKMARDTKDFGIKLEKEVKIPVAFQDESLTTLEAREISIKLGIKRKKRNKMEDAYSAALILQSYLDSLRK